MRAVDLFAGAGGFSTGATMAGCSVVWAANHWPLAVQFHEANHPGAQHVCQDLHQANWSRVPAHDLLLASPCCQGHSKARGKSAGNPQHDESRSTAWAVVSALEFHRPSAAVIENVPEFLDWALYPAWSAAMEALGYSLSPHVIDAAEHGVPQHRVRMFIVATRSRAPIELNLQPREHVPATSFVDFSAGRWSLVDKPGRAAATLERVRNGRRCHGDRFLSAYYGNERGGRSMHRPIGTITTRDRWAVVDGERMRMLSAQECRAAMGFPAEYVLPTQHREAVHLLGNAVCPPVARDVINALRAAI
ncbi:DNA cytosine methyltransferase [Diaphorobacter caeni]|uniref:DNA cytosine methyltransferase n=1 Tax=Diaphorobacter caeni TaxID=2784387 RepID=UPI00188E0F4F|nr:DNA cytosine methyltransferase [Diaphorobacter caeni]MBF5006980.1 DNA cytosine methyltransferase [Diaphorobacter caeni]